MKLKSPKIKEIKPFIPCSPNGLDESVGFYQEIGFSVIKKTDKLVGMNKRHNLSELFFWIKWLQNRCIAVVTELFLSRFSREKSRSKVSII